MTDRFAKLLLAFRARLVPEEIGVEWMPFWTLAYLGFLSMPLLLPQTARADWGWPTLVAVLVFLPLYFRGYWAGSRELGLIVLAMLLLGISLVKVTLFANTFVVFACGFAPWLGDVRRGMFAALALLAAFSACVLIWGVGGPLNVGITAVVGAASFVGNYLVGENVRKQAALRLSHDEVRRLAAMAERERIGRDLHDLLGHTLSLIALKSELATRLWHCDSEAALREVGEVERVAREALAQVRHAVSGIRAAGLAAELASARLMLESSAIGFQYEADLHALPPEVETCIALAVREAVTNIQRHSKATRATVNVLHEPHALVVIVADNGRGGDIMPGNGLTGMRERLSGIGGTLGVDSVRGRGTTLSIRVPLADPDGGIGANLAEMH